MKNIILILILIINISLNAKENSLKLENIDIVKYNINNIKMYNHFNNQLSNKFKEYTTIEKNNTIIKLLLKELKNYKEALLLCNLMENNSKECNEEWILKKKEYTLFISELKKMERLLKKDKYHIFKII